MPKCMCREVPLNAGPITAEMIAAVLERACEDAEILSYTVVRAAADVYRAMQLSAPRQSQDDARAKRAAHVAHKMKQYVPQIGGHIA